MPRIMGKMQLAPGINRFDLHVPAIADKAKPGQFVIVKNGDKGERIPLTIAASDTGRGTITIIFQEVGRGTMELGRLQQGENLSDVVGPLGKPADIRQYGDIVCVGGGVGAAPLLPIARALRQCGNRVKSIIGARSRDYLILVEQMEAVSEELILVTDDGSGGEKGLVTEPLARWLRDGLKPDLAIAIGPLNMMRAVSELTRSYGVPTLVSLNPIMLDGTGMCGACRVSIGGITKFACVDGPEFDGHLVDWDLALQRSAMFREEEAAAIKLVHDRGECHCR